MVKGWARALYRNGREIMAVAIELKPAFESGRLERLFEGDFVVEPYGLHDYDVSLDGKHFLMCFQAPLMGYPSNLEPMTA